MISLYAGRVVSPKILRQQTAHEDKRHGGEVAVPVGAGGIKKSAAGIGVEEKVHAQAVRIPFKARLQVVLPALGTDTRIRIIKNIVIDRPYKNIREDDPEGDRPKRGDFLLYSGSSFSVRTLTGSLIERLLLGGKMTGARGRFHSRFQRPFEKKINKNSQHRLAGVDAISVAEDRRSRIIGARTRVIRH